jgi:AraC family transcriptional regulator
MENSGVNNRLTTEIDYRQRINRAMNFMRDHVGTNLSIHEVALTANFSAFHFHRIFTAYTGETPGDYMNRIKMIEAALSMKEGLNTTQAAVRIGYKTPSAFIKAFKKTFGILPSAFKQLNPDRMKYIVRPMSAVSYVTPEFRKLPALNLYIVRKQGKLNENFTKVASEAFEELHSWLRKTDQFKKVSIRLGILHDFDLFNANDCRYDACVVIRGAGPSTVGAPIQMTSIQAGTWAVFLHKGPYDTLWQTWNFIYNSWYPLSGIELREDNPFEVYLNNKNETPPADLLTEIHIPVF